jgi:16S rRNA (cytidine1402-2'-O)-methyltransferase
MKEQVSEDRAGTGAGAGVLYLVATPIGNLEDITLRALRVLRESDVIACEDTRQTQKLLNHYDISTRTTSYHEHNERSKAPELLARLQTGKRVALVSDAGMPGISDPGYQLIRLSIEHGIPVIPIPGPNAVIASIAASGLPTHAFQFLGFIPVRKQARRKLLQEVGGYPSTSIFFEAPHRIQETLADIIDVLGDRPVALAREMTKLHEEFLRGACSEVLRALRKRDTSRGEVTLLLGPGESVAATKDAPVTERVEELMREQSLTRMQALKAVARERRISKREAYRAAQASSEASPEASPEE